MVTKRWLGNTAYTRVELEGYTGDSLLVRIPGLVFARDKGLRINQSINQSINQVAKTTPASFKKKGGSQFETAALMAEEKSVTTFFAPRLRASKDASIPSES